MKVKLCDAFDLQMGKTPARNDLSLWNGEHKWISIGDIGKTGKYIVDTKECISKEGVLKSGIKVVPKGTVIMSFKLSIGKAAITAEDMYTNEAIMAFIDKKKYAIDTTFLYYLLSGMNWSEGSNKAVMGVTLNKATLSQKVISIPSVDDQRFIAAVLDKVSNLISLRKQQIAKLEELVKFRFIELFGDPVDNDREWQTQPLDSVCKTIVDCPHSTPNYTDDDTGYMCIRTSIVKKNRIVWDEIEYISEKEYYQRIQRKRPEKGDVVYTREGAILGIAAMIDRECNVALGQRSMLLSPDTTKCLPLFLSAAMNFESFLRKALSGVSGSASPHINVGDIKAFAIILPPIELQQQFAAFVEQVDKSKLAVQQGLDKLETLKKALMQQYFG